MINVLTPPMRHQEEAFYKFLRSKWNAAFMDMGTGKTLVAIMLAAARQQRGKIDRVIWFTPVSLKDNVAREIKKHTGTDHLTHVFSATTDEDRVPAVFWYVVGLESMGSSGRTVLTVNKILDERTMVIVDESGYIKGHLYDLFHYAGLTPHQMRVASPFHSAAKGSLALYKVIDPHVWGKMVSRVNGVNFTALYGSTAAMGWRKVTKPSHLTWKQYAMFLLETLPPATAENFKVKLATSIKFWRERGGVLSEETLEDMRDAGIEFELGESTNYKTNKLPVRMEYIDEVKTKDENLVPTWKRLCITILKNDHTGKTMGFSQTKAETAKRKSALEKYKAL